MLHGASSPSPRPCLCSPDIDECAEGSHACRYNQLCQNTAGTYRCVCPPGYHSLGTGWPCLGTSWAQGHSRSPALLQPQFPHPAATPHLFPPPDINECLQFPPPCAFECRNLRGSYKCLCPSGRTLLPDGECGAAEEDGGDTTDSTHRNIPARRLGPSSPWEGSLYTQLALRRVAKDVGLGARGPPCPMGFIRRNGTCTGECASGKGFAGSSEAIKAAPVPVAALSPICLSPCPWGWGLSGLGCAGNGW